MLSFLAVGLAPGCSEGDDPPPGVSCQGFADCVDPCGNFYGPDCIDGDWVCADVGDTCEDPPGGACDEATFGDCVDGCGDLYAPSCVGGSWVCHGADDACDDLPIKSAVWSHSFGSLEYEIIDDVVLDGDGNLYVTASFREGLEFDDGKHLEAAGGYDTFVAKYDATGEVAWIAQLGSAGDDLPHGLELHPSGRLAVLMTSSAEAGTTPEGGPASLVWLGTSDGALLFTDDLGLSMGIHDDENLAVDQASGDVIVVGTFGSESNGFPNAEFPTFGEADIFVLRRSAEGETVWSRSFGGASWDYAVALDVDAAGRIFIAGTFKQAIEIDDVTLEPISGFDGFVLAIDGDGQALWGKTLASEGAGVVGDVTGDDEGGVVLTGTFETAAQLGSSSFTASTADPEALVARLGDGGDVVFAHAYGRARPGGSIQSPRGWHVDLVESGDLMLAGTQYHGVEDDDLFIARLDRQTGERLFEVTRGDDNSSSVHALDAHGDAMAIAGEFFGGLDVGNGPLTSFTQGAGFVSVFTADIPLEF